MDTHDQDALAHYEGLIALRYPPHLAAALAAARYQVALEHLQTALAQNEVASLAAVRSTLAVVQQTHPDLKRDAGRTIAAIDRKGTIKGRDNRRS